MKFDIKNLKQIRRSLGLSQIAFAGKVGVSMLTVRMWEGGASTPNPTNMAKIQEVLDQAQAEQQAKSKPVRTKKH